jgi:oxygen-independent coproporphyrinogen III oxidase
LTSDLVGLYVHIPFCSLKCYYCDFTAVAHHGHMADRYLNAVEAEWRLKAGASRPDTLYVGGGTPSELSAEQINRLFAFLPKGLKEITFECNPESVTAAKIEALAAAGVTRISLGLQTSDDKLLRSIGRQHTAEQFVGVYKALRAAGRFAVSVDLMYNLPGQSVQSCSDSLEFVLGLQPEHLSLYGLQVEDQTLFGKRAITPDEDQGREMFERCLDRLAAAGYHHYEVSNFARPGFEAEHNLIYWRNGEYVGLGCGAAQYLKGIRSTNLDRLGNYMSAVEAGRNPVDESESLQGKEALGEAMMLGLRLLDGFKPTAEMTAAFAAELNTLQERKLIRRFSEHFIALTRDGLFVANEVFRELLPPYSAQLVTP